MGFCILQSRQREKFPQQALVHSTFLSVQYLHDFHKQRFHCLNPYSTMRLSYGPGIVCSYILHTLIVLDFMTYPPFMLDL